MVRTKSILIAFFASILILCSKTDVYSQITEISPQVNASLTISGRVIQDLSAQNIQIELLADVNLVAEPGQAIIEIDPITTSITSDPELPGSGFALAKGEPGATFVITFPRWVELTNVNDNSTLLVQYLIAHNSSIDQPTSIRVREVAEEFTLNANGEYYFWFGGSVDITGITSGEYEGDFFMEVEYKL